MESMWKPWSTMRRWACASNESAVANARAASTELHRRRVERQEVEHFLRQYEASPVAARGATPRPA